MQPRLEFVDVLRGLAATAVAWFHLTNTYDSNLVKMSGDYGWLGVEVFFVISGFVIPYSIARSTGTLSFRDFPSFMARRLVRLEPPYIASILLVILLYWLSAAAPGFRGQAYEFDAYQVAAHFLYAIPLTDYGWLQPVYWTLAFEFVFYIVAGIFFGVMSDRRLWPWLLFAGTVALLVVGPFPARALLFVMGIAVFRRMETGDGILLTVSTIFLAACIMAARGAMPEGLVGAAASLSILFLARVRLPDSIFARAALGLGTISYSLYLVHVPVGGRVVNLGLRFVDGPWQQLALSLVALAVSLAFATLFWRLIERPAIVIAKRFSVQPKTVSALP